MTCLECNIELGYVDHKNSMDSLGEELCSKHRIRMEKLIEQNGTPLEAIQLYYGLKAEGISAML